MRKVFLDDLPRKEGRGSLKEKEVIDWANCKNNNVVKFIYDDIDGYVTIVDYNSKHQLLTVRYKSDEFSINTGNFSKCNLGKVVGKVTSEYKVEIGQIINDKNRYLVITDKEKINGKKYYKYTCNVCNYSEGKILESNLLNQKNGCSCCVGRTTVCGINSIHDTAPWMIDLGVDFEEAKMFTKSSGKKIKCVCPHCGKVIYKTPHVIHKTKSIACVCGDGFSYPEKFMYSVLKQLGVEFKVQYNPEWTGRKFYDFYIHSLNMIIETHGLQHYREGTGIYTNKLLKEQNNDKFKKELALNNGIERYIELDCRYSELEYVKNSILNSKLNELFDLRYIDWLKCEEYAIKSNLVKEVCNCWNNKQEWETIRDLVESGRFGSHSLILKCLQQGNSLGWCQYNAEQEKVKSLQKATKNSNATTSKKVLMYKNNEFIGKFESCHELDRCSERLYNVKLNYSSIAESCRTGKRYKGYTFKYTVK